ncbi:DUF192 domain-containing protein [Ponticoccus sp. (in: a-proteobacteria)]|uniref:DUF192 domain-containing protein n=2 Tax=Ponticoccus TaxID=983507 RepID=UPI003AB90518
MGNRLVALSSVLVLGLATALCAADEGAERLPIPSQTAGTPDAPAADPATAKPATEDEARSPGAALAASDLPSAAAQSDDPDAVAAPARDKIVTPIAPIGQEDAAPPQGDATLLAGEFPAIDPTAPACREDTILLRGDFGKARFSVTVADDGPERAQGLMHVKSMPPSFGMLFVFPSARPVSFWMKNTLIPLDMIFADRHGVVRRVHAMAQPGDLTQIPGGDNIQYVLEINGGMAGMLGIKPGSQMRHPAISDPAWRCN